MIDFLMYPCTKTGKLLKGFCPTRITSMSAYVDTMRDWIRFSDKFGIKYYFIDGQIKPLL